MTGNRDVQFRLRMAIYYVYVDVLGAPEKCEWKGTKGAICKILQMLGLDKARRNIVKRVLQRINAMANMGVVYAGERAEKRQFDNYMISCSSVEMQIIADAMESGFGLRLTTELLNEHRR